MNYKSHYFEPKVRNPIFFIEIVSKGRQITLIMCFFLSLLALKSRKIRLLKPDSCNIKGSYTSINERVTSTTCPYSLSIMSSSFRGIRYNTGNWISSYLGGAIYLKSNPEVVMFDNKFEQLLAGNDGGAAYFDGVAIINSTKNKFLNCEANSGGAIYITDSKSVINVIDNQFESLTGHFRGAALYVDKSKELKILNTSLANINLLDERGDGGSLYFSTIVSVDINQCLINKTRCSYGSGGAGFFDKLSDLNITKTNFVGCYAQDHGGALHIQSSSTINIIENLFSSCEMVNESNINQRIGGAINIETSNPVYLQRNSFINCYAYHYGGAISFYSSDRLTLLINTFNNCSVKNNQGGAISARSLENISFAENIFKKCYANQYGGAIYLESITNGSFFILRDEFIECNSSDYGGAISLYNVNGIVIKEIKCSKCKSSQGGVLYTYDMKAGIEISDSAFTECEAYNDGGAVCVDRKRVGRIQVIYIKITETNFTKCKASTGSGGGLFIERNVNYIILKSSHFLSCFAKLNGAALYYKYDFSFIKDEVLISSGLNIFEDCESGNLGTVAISSYNVDSALFENETYINCRAATGGAFMADITDYSQFFFVGCEISNCSATLKCGAFGFKLGNTKNDNSSVINIRRCSFFNCSSREAACIGTESTYPAFVSLNIEGENDILTSFNSINGINNRYVIITDAYNLKIRFAVFNQVEIGAIQTSGNNLNLSACSFNFCTSTYSIIKCDLLRIFNINDTTFSHCSNCFQITSLSKGIISSLIFTDIEYDFPSIISSDLVDIDNLKIQNNTEPIQLNVNKLYINGGSLINSSKIIRIIGSGRGDSLTIINDLNVENSLMFLVEKMANARIINSNITYDSINSVGESIIVSRTVITSLINCSFLTNNINSIEFTIPSSSARLQGCTFDGNDSLIKVGNSLSLRNNTFKSNGRYFNILTSGVLLFYLSSN